MENIVVMLQNRALAAAAVTMLIAAIKSRKRLRESHVMACRAIVGLGKGLVLVRGVGAV